MKIVLEINDQSGCNFSKKKIKLAIEETVRESGLSEMLPQELMVSVGVVSLPEMQKINLKYRGKDSSTDVLSFANYSDQKSILATKERDIFLGEVIVCLEDVKDYSNRKGISSEEETIRVISHGVLHLLGFSHGRRMFSIQEKVAKNFHKK